MAAKKKARKTDGQLEKRVELLERVVLNGDSEARKELQAMKAERVECPVKPT